MTVSFAAACVCAKDALKGSNPDLGLAISAVALSVMNFARSVGAFEFPHTATTLLLAVNILVLCARHLQRSGMPAPSPDVLLRSGANLQRRAGASEYWRLVAYAFLHGSMLHILTNMALPGLVGRPSREAVSAPAYFLLIYFVSVIAGSLTGIFIHPGLLPQCRRVRRHLRRSRCATMPEASQADRSAGELLRHQPRSQHRHRLSRAKARLGCASRRPHRGHGGRAQRSMRSRSRDRQLMRCKFPEFVKLNLGVLFAVVAWLTDFSLVAMLAALCSVDRRRQRHRHRAVGAARARLDRRDARGGQCAGAGAVRSSTLPGTNGAIAVAGEPRALGRVPAEAA